MDCVEGMKQFPDKFFDLCITDPPYGVDIEYGCFDDSKQNLKRFISEFMPEILRVSKTAIITCGNGNQHLYPEPTWTLAWVIKAGAGQSKWGFTCWQPILAYGDDPIRKHKKYALPDIIEMKSLHSEPMFSTNHPCPKPLNFWEKLMLRASPLRTDKILDPFTGSGTTALACHNHQREFWGFELDTDYYNAATERLNKAKAQVTFDELIQPEHEQISLQERG